MMWMQFNWFDYCVIGLVLFSSLIGWARGLVQELSSVANWVIGGWAGFIGYEWMGECLPELVQPPIIRDVIGFFIVFAFALFCVTFISKGVKWLIISLGLKAPDAVLGAFFGVLRGIAIFLLFIVITRPSFGQSDVWKSSVCIPYFEPLAYWLVDFFPDELHEQDLHG